LSRAHATLNAVLDSNHREVAATGKNVIKGFTHIVDGNPRCPLGSVNLT
jgi:hypothetical protein